jgi:hypothetical protein
MRIDIDQLDEAELRDLNHRIVERLRFLQQMRAHTAMLKLSIGDRVSFRGHDGEEVRGRVVRYNRKTVTVLADDGAHWRIPPDTQQDGTGEGDQRERDSDAAFLRFG